MEQLPAGINAVFVCPPGRKALWRTTVSVINRTAGVRPAMKRESESATRAIYAPATSKVIVNMASPAMHDLLGRHYCAITLDVENPFEAAERALAIFMHHGYVANAYREAEPEFPRDLVVFVVVRELEGIVLLYRQSKPSPEILAQIPKAEPWTDDDFVTG